MSTTEYSPAELRVSPPARTRTSSVRRRTPIGSEPAPDWRRSAACVERDLNTFFPISSVGAAAQQQILEAKRICSECPVQSQCLEWALEVGPEFGIFGGRTEEERRALRLQSGKATRWRNRPVIRAPRSEEAVAEALEPR